MGRRRKSDQAEEESITVLDVKPVRTLVPMFPAPQGFYIFTPPNKPSFVCVTPFGPPNTESMTVPPGFTPGQVPQEMLSMDAPGAPTPQSVKTPSSNKMQRKRRKA